MTIERCSGATRDKLKILNAHSDYGVRHIIFDVCEYTRYSQLEAPHGHIRGAMRPLLEKKASKLTPSYVDEKALS